MGNRIKPQYSIISGGIIIFATAAAISLAALLHLTKKQVGQRETPFERNRNLVARVNEKAAGSDKILSREEAIKMARDLGYEGVINQTKPLEFFYSPRDNTFYIGKYDGGGETQYAEIPRKRALQYLNESEEKQ